MYIFICIYIMYVFIYVYVYIYIVFYTQIYLYRCILFYNTYFYKCTLFYMYIYIILYCSPSANTDPKLPDSASHIIMKYCSGYKQKHPYQKQPRRKSCKSDSSIFSNYWENANGDSGTNLPSTLSRTCAKLGPR